MLRSEALRNFSFLGYTFGPHRYKPDGHWYLGASPSKKSRQRIQQKAGDLLIPGNVGGWEEVRDRLNLILRGWSAYFFTVPARRRIAENEFWNDVRTYSMNMIGQPKVPAPVHRTSNYWVTGSEEEDRELPSSRLKSMEPVLSWFR